MKIEKFSKVNMSLTGPLAEAASFKIILFLTDVTKDEVKNWEPDQVTKSYGPGDIATDFPTTSHAYKVASGIFAQNPAVTEFKVGRRDPGQSVPDALDVIEGKKDIWFTLVGLRGLNDILSAAAWVEAQPRKFMFACSYDQDIGTSSDQSIAAILNNLGYQQTALFYNNQAGVTFPDDDLDLTVLDGVCSVIISNGQQTEEVMVDTVVEDFTYTIDIDAEQVSYTSGKNYNKQSNRITVARYVEAHTYRLSVAGVTVEHTATAEDEEAVKNALKIAVNADLVLQQKMTAIDDPDDTSSLILTGETKNISYEIIPGVDLIDTPLPVEQTPTKAEIAAILQTKLIENTVINALLTVTLSGEKNTLVIKDATGSFVITVSANLTKTTVVSDYKLKVGDPLNVSGVETPLALNGDNTITEVTAPNEFKFLTTAADGVPVGTIQIEVNYTFPDAALAAMGLAYPNGALDWAHQDIVGVRPETEEHLTNDVIANLEANNANVFHVTAGVRLLWQGRTVSELFIDIVIDGLMYLPTRMEESIFNFITSLPKVPMSDASLGGLKNAMDRTLEIEGRERGITAPFIEDFVNFPETGYPAGARPGDHYVSRVPRVQDIPITDRQERRITSGVEFEFQSSGGIHVIVTSGILHQ